MTVLRSPEPASQDSRACFPSLFSQERKSVLAVSATVHFQHTAELVKMLSASNVNYTLQIFPDEGHTMASTKSQHNMLNSVLTFFKLCFEEEQVVALEKSKDHD